MACLRRVECFVRSDAVGVRFCHSETSFRALSTGAGEVGGHNFRHGSAGPLLAAGLGCVA